MRPLVLLPFLMLAAPAAGQEPGELKYFGDWAVGCDNRLSCTAIGFSPEAEPVFAYLRVTREAGADSGPIVSVTMLDEMAQGGPIGVSLPDGDLPVESLEAAGDGSNFASAELGPVDHGAFLDALLPEPMLDVSLGEETVPVSLTGMSAALRYMDAIQGRAGTGGALVAKGERPADTVPLPPAAIIVDAQPLSEIAEPGERPAGLPEPEEFCPEGSGDLVIEAEDGTRLWGICSSAGAYNLSYEFHVVRDGEAVAADLGPQGAGFGEAEDGSTLVNPYLSDDGRTLNAFAKARGLGDCGTATSFAFDGEGVRLVGLSAMGECRGVQPDDWPVLYSAEIE